MPKSTLDYLSELRQPEEQESALRKRFPELYGTVGGLFGLAPEDFSGSVLDPNTSKVKEGADIGFPLGLAASVLPFSNVRGFFSTAAKQLPNKLPNWYGGGALGKVDSAARLFGIGSLNTARQYLTPTGQAMLRDQVPMTLKRVADKQYKIAEDARSLAASKIEQIKADTTLSQAEKLEKINGVKEETNKIVAAAGKTYEGQKGYTDLLDIQYGTNTPLVRETHRDVNLATGNFDLETFKSMHPDAAEGVFERIAQNQKMIPGEGMLVLRKVSGNAAGDLRRDVYQKSDVAKKINNAFAKQPVGKPFTGLASFKQAIDYGKLTGREKKILDNPEVQKYLKSAFRGESPLKNAKTAEEFSAVLKENNISIPKSLVAKAFRGVHKAPFKDNAELIKALEAEGLKILPENKKRALEGGNLILSDSVVTGSLDLGGANVVHTVHKNGRKSTYINDENDIWGIAPPGGKRLVSVASFTEDLLGPNSGLGETLKAAENVVKLQGKSPFHNMTKSQQKGIEDMRNYVANPLMSDYGNALRNNLLIGGGLGYALYPEDEE